MSKYSLDQFTYNLKTNSWDRVPRDPVTMFVGHTLFGAGVLTATQMFIAQAIVFVGASLVTGYLLGALMPKAPDGSRELTASVKDAAAPREIVYGEVRKGGVITHLESTDDNKYLHMFVALAGHEIESVESIYINDEDQTANWTRSSGLITGGSGTDWKNKVRVFAHLGAQTSASDTFENSTKTLANTYHTETELSDVNSNFIGKGVAYLYIRHEYDKDVYADGIPEVSVVVRGKKVQNTSGVAQTYPNSANAALVIRDYLINEYGVGDDSTNIDATSFATAQTVCNTSSGSGASNKFRVNGVLSTSNSRIDNLETLTAACGGALFWGSGKWKLKAAAFTSSVKTLTMADLRGNVQIDTKHSVRDNFNAVRGTFFDKDQDWIEVDYPEIAPSVYLTEDNNEKNVLDLPFQVVTNSAQAQRLAKLTLNRHREQLTFSANFGLEAFDLEVGDIIKFNDYNAQDGTYRYGFYSTTPADQKTFEVIGWKFAPVDEDNDLQVTLTLRETSSTAFDWDAEEETIVGNNTNLPKPFTGVNVSNLTVSDGGGEVQGDGSVVNSLVASWDVPDSAFINYYEIRWGQTSSANRTTFTTTDTSVILSPVVDGVEYTVQVRAVTANGFRGAFASTTATAGGDTTAPAKVTSGSLEAVGVLEGIEVKWENPADADFSHVEIYESNDSNFSNATQVGRSSGNTFLRGNIVGGTTKYFWVRTKDFSGNPTGSATVGQTRGPVSATSKVVTASDVAAAVIGYENLAEDVDVLLQDARKKIDDLGTQSLTEVLGRYKDRKRSEERDAIITQDMSAGINEANQAVADLRTELVSQFDGNLAAIVDQLTTIADDASANATSIEGLIADVAGNTGAIAEINTVSADSSSALARSVASLDVDVADNTASIDAINDVSASSDSAAAQSLFNLNASVSGLQTDVSNAQADITAAEADILQINNVSADSSSAIAQSVNDLNVALEFDDGTETYGRITEIADLRADLTGVEAKYGVTVDANGNIGGFQLLSGEGGSAFNVAADQFNIFNPDGDTSGRPFTVFSTLREVDGITYPIGVYMDQAYIDSANIVDATITTAKIKDAAITNAKIGSVIQSENYSAGSDGWKINKDGSAEFNGVVISRQLLVDSGTYTHGSASISRRTTIGESFSVYLESTNTPISAWAGANKTYICNVGVTGSISANTGDVPDVYWGWTGEILPLTRWSSNQTLRLKLTFWTKKVTSFTNLKANWKIYEVT